MQKYRSNVLQLHTSLLCQTQFVVAKIVGHAVRWLSTEITVLKSTLGLCWSWFWRTSHHNGLVASILACVLARLCEYAHPHAHELGPQTFRAD